MRKIIKNLIKKPILIVFLLILIFFLPAGLATPATGLDRFYPTSISIDLLENGEYEVILSSDETYYGGYSSLKHKKYKVKNNRLTIDLPAIAGIILRKVK